MRDYKNVKVPRKYRAEATRVSVKRAAVRRSGRTGRGAAGLKSMLLNILGFAVIAGCCWTGWQAYEMITHAELFQISGVDVTGVRHLEEEDLKNIVGNFTGQNIFRVDIDGAVRRARANPWVKDARIHRSLPNRIAMNLVERVPAAVLETDAGRYLMDNEAVVIDRLTKDAASAWQLPTVAIRGCRVLLGEPVAAESVFEALTLSAEIDARGGWNPGDVTIKASSPEALSIVYADHEFKIGSGKYAQKLRRLAEVMTDVKQRGLTIAYVDLRAERQAAVMMKTTGGKGKNK